MAGGRDASASEEDGEGESDDVEDEDDFFDEAEMERQAEVAKNRGPRRSVSAEPSGAQDTTTPVHPKMPEQQKQIEAALRRSFLFSSLDAAGFARLVAAAAGPHHFAAGDEVIVEGDIVGADDPGLFVVDMGTLAVCKKKPGVAGRGPKILSYDTPGQFFGELALLYNCPRAATVVAVSTCRLWSIDRVTFNACVRGTHAAIRRRHERVLESVQALKSLPLSDKEKLLDVIQVRTHEAGEQIIRQGERGDEFFILQEGSASAHIDGLKVKDYGPGEYFGELALIDERPRKADVVAESHVSLLVIDGDSFRRLLGPAGEAMASEYRRASDASTTSSPAPAPAPASPPSKVPPPAKQSAAARALKAVGRLTGVRTSRTGGHGGGEKAGGASHPVAFGTEDGSGSSFVDGPTDTLMSQAQLAEFLQTVDIFEGMLTGDLEELAQAVKPMTFQPGERVIRQGEMGYTFFIVRAGCLHAFVDGRRVKEYGPSDYFGELAVLRHAPRGADITVADRDGQPALLYALDRESFWQFLGPLAEEFTERAQAYLVASSGLPSPPVPPDDKDAASSRSGSLTSADRRLLEPTPSPPAGWKPPVHSKSGEAFRKLAKAVQQSPLLSFLPRDAQEKVVAAFSGPIEMKRAATVVKEGAVHHHVEHGIFLLMHGMVDIFKAQEGVKGAGLRLRQCNFPGETFGDAELVAGTGSRYTIVASTNVELWALDKETFAYLVRNAYLGRLKQREDLLATIDIFQGLSRQERRRLAQLLYDRTLRRGQYIIRAGDECKEFYIVDEGSASVEVNRQEVRRYAKAAYFGELALMSPAAAQAADVSAAATPTRLLVLDAIEFRNLLGTESPVSEAVRRRAQEYFTARSARRSSVNNPLLEGLVKPPSPVSPRFPVSPGRRSSAAPRLSSVTAAVAREGAGAAPGAGAGRGRSQSDASVMSAESDQGGSDASMEELAVGLRRGKMTVEPDSSSEESSYGYGTEEAIEEYHAPQPESEEDAFAESLKMALTLRKGRRWCVCGETWDVNKEWLHHQMAKSPDQATRIMEACMKLFMFALMPSEDLKVLVGVFKGPLRVPASEIVMRQGQYVSLDEPALYVVESGSLDGFRAHGGVPLPGEHCRTFGPGHSFGETALLHDAPRTLTVVARTESFLWWIDRQAADNVVKESFSLLRRRREAFLEGVPTLSSLTRGERSIVADSMYSRNYAKGEMVIKMGDEGDEFFMIEEGSAEASIEGRTVKAYSKNEYFGELALITRRPRAADVIATSTPTRLAVLTAHSFRSLLGSLDEIMLTRAQAYMRVALGPEEQIEAMDSMASLEGIRRHRRHSLVGRRSLELLDSASRGQSAAAGSRRAGSKAGVDGLAGSRQQWQAPKDSTWTCLNRQCQFINFEHVGMCMNCAEPRRTAQSNQVNHWSSYSSYGPAWMSVGSYGAIGPIGNVASQQSLALVPASVHVSVQQSDAASVARSGGAAVDQRGPAPQAPWPTATAGVDVRLAPASLFAELSPSAPDASPAEFEGAHLMRHVSRTREVGIVQWPFPVAPGERFLAKVVSKGTFGEVGLGLAPLRSACSSQKSGHSAGTSPPRCGAMNAAHCVMVGWAQEEAGFHGDRGRCYIRGRATKAGPPWHEDDIIECGLTLRGRAYFMRNGELVAEADGVWPTAQAYPTVTLHSAGAELLVSWREVGEKSLQGLGAGGFETRSAWDLLATFRRTVVEEKKKKTTPVLSTLDRWFGDCGIVTPACGGCTQIEAAGK